MGESITIVEARAALYEFECELQKTLDQFVQAFYHRTGLAISDITVAIPQLDVTSFKDPAPVHKPGSVQIDVQVTL